MQVTLPDTRTFAYVCGGTAAVMVVMMGIGNAIEAALGTEPAPWVQTVARIFFFSLVLVIAYSAWALAVRSIVGGLAAFWTHLAAAIGRNGIAHAVARTRPIARKVGDIVILVGWAIWTAGLAIAMPAMIRDGFW